MVLFIYLYKYIAAVYDEKVPSVITTILALKRNIKCNYEYFLFVLGTKPHHVVSNVLNIKLRRIPHALLFIRRVIGNMLSVERTCFHR